ncbi:MAG: glycosyltransferase family 4 protein [Thermoplasmata archaeon]
MPKVLIVGPLPPPHGGIAIFIKYILTQSSLKQKYKISLYRTGRKSRETPLPSHVLSQAWLFLKFPFDKEFLDADIVHIHSSSFLGFYYNALYLFISRIFNSKAKIIFHYHGVALRDFYQFANPIGKFLIRKCFEDSDFIISPSKLILEDIHKICKNPNLRRIRNGVDISKFKQISQNEARATLGLPLDKKIIFNVSNLVVYKGHKYLISAIKEILKERKDIICIIGGQGPERDNLLRKISELKLEGHVRLIGFIPDEYMSLWLNACDVFVLPSLYESFGIVLVEALACGKPLVATRTAGSVEVITSDDYGLLCKPADPTDLANKILIALEKKWDSNKILKYVTENFTWEKVAEELGRIYEECLSSKSVGKIK